MKLCQKLLAFGLLFLLGFGAITVACFAKTHFSARDLIVHCTNINKGDILPFPKGCATPVEIVDNVFTFVNAQGVLETYVIVTKRDGTFQYYEVNHS